MKPWETPQRRNYLYCNCNYCVLAAKAIELNRERLRNLRGETETEFVRNSKVLVDFEVNMNRKKKSCRCLGLGLDSGLHLAISRFIYSFA